MARISGQEKWTGGYIHVTKAGRKSFVILRRVDGRLYERSTGASSEATALQQLARFEADPEGYTPAPLAAAALHLDRALAKLFLTWSLEEKKNTPEWVREQRRVLAWWATKLKGKDLRRLDLKLDVLPPLKKQKARGQRIAVLKTLFSWLRFEQHELNLAQDPLVGQLRAPKTRPEQARRLKVIPLQDLIDVHRRLLRPYSDALELQVGTGWHMTEVRRWAMGQGDVEDLPAGREAEGSGVLRLDKHKNGSVHRTVVGASVLEAARRLRANGKLSLQYYRRALAAAARSVTGERREKDAKAGAVAVHPGSIRHTVATYAKNTGVPIAVVGDFLGHDAPETTRKFYATHAIPAKVSTPDLR
jgi:site-specific recombinase XerC